MTIYEFRCECGEDKTLNISYVDYYIPKCDNCDKLMNRVYTVPNIDPSALPTRGL